MILAQCDNDAKVELTNVDKCTIHFGTVSFKVSIEHFFDIALLFNPASKEAPDSSICSVMKISDNKFVFCYNGITLAMCGNALSGFAALINESEKKHLEIFNRDSFESKEDIDSILSIIENKQ